MTIKSSSQDQEIIELDANFSTTRRMTMERPAIINDPSLKVQSHLFLPPNLERKGEGGLRTRGYFKVSCSEVTTNKYTPLITIITVVFNGDKHLEQTVISVINQTYNNVEYIIIDGGSTDSTIDILHKYEEVIDYWVSEPDKGIYDAMNKALTIAKGDWILFLGSDDILINCLEELSIILKNPSNIYYGDVYSKRKHKLYGGRFDFARLVVQNICQQSIFYPKEVFQDRNFDLIYEYLADYHFNMITYREAKFKFSYIPKLVAIYGDEGVSYQRTDIQFVKMRNKFILTKTPWLIFSPMVVYKGFFKTIRHGNKLMSTLVKKIRWNRE
jgi:glycosyltransferase involved in cell wall biosynthesis